MSSGKEKIPPTNNLVNRLYKSANKKNSLAHHASQLPHLDVFLILV